MEDRLKSLKKRDRPDSQSALIKLANLGARVAVPRLCRSVQIGKRENKTAATNTLRGCEPTAIMPFKLRLKKSRQYNVLSKSLFVIVVEMLEGAPMECTLSGESTGQECLDNVCQRLGLQQPGFFGLRYNALNGTQRWLEMDRPVKRQLDKHARDSSLYLRVMYYIRGVDVIQDEMTRYHYFLQLKMDVLEGKISCDAKQAVQLASYSMQAEFGNHDLERHTAEYLKDFALFPKHLTEQGHLETLTEGVIRQHMALRGLSQASAEEYYILAAQNLNGYGQELFFAKDEQGNEVEIGVCLTGVAVTNHNKNIFYRWRDITNVVNQKRYFGIECQKPEDSVNFQFSDVESAKYVWRMCVEQHTFFQEIDVAENEGETPARQLFTHPPTEEQIGESREELDGPSTQVHNNWTVVQSLPHRAQSTSCLDLAQDVDKLRALLPSYRPAPDYETAVQQKYHNAVRTEALRTHMGLARPAHQIGMLYSSQPEIHQTHLHESPSPYSAAFKHFPDVTGVEWRLVEHEEDRRRLAMKPGSIPNAHTYSTPDLDTVENHLVGGIQQLQFSKPPPPYPINRPSSNSTPDLASQALCAPRPHLFSPQVSGSSPDLVSSRSLGLGRAMSQQPLGHHGIPVGYSLLPNPENHRTYSNLTTAAAAESQHQKHRDDLRRAFEQSATSAYVQAEVVENGLAPPQQFRSNNTTSSGQGQEPIYENVPLLWLADGKETGAGEGGGPRSRASSIQSAPDMSRNVNSTASNNAVRLIPMALEKTSVKMNVIPAPRTSLLRNNERLDQRLQHPISQKNPQETQTQTPQAYHQTITDNSSHPVDPTPVVGQPPRPSLNSTVSSTNSSSSSKTAQRKGRRRKWAALGILGGSRGRDHSASNNSSVTDTKHRWSTGLPLPPTVSKETMCQVLEKKLADRQLFFEFEKIPKRRQNADFSTALEPENAARNRFKDVLPYDENRVRLTPSKDNRFGYINASHITATVGDQQRFYVAAQGPLPSTLANFWQMVWEADIYLVVNLVGLSEEGAIQYLPNVTERSLDLGDFQVWWQFSQERGHSVTTKLQLLQTATGRMRGVWHLQYPEWGDQGCPNNVGHFLGFLEELNSVRQHTVSEIPAGHNRNPPVLVHCSAGVGRTGVTILSDLLLYTLDHNQELDIPRVVGTLRHQRVHMVQTVAQYRFVHSLLIHYLKHSRLI